MHIFASLCHFLSVLTVLSLVVSRNLMRSGNPYVSISQKNAKKIDVTETFSTTFVNKLYEE